MHLWAVQYLFFYEEHTINNHMCIKYKLVIITYSHCVLIKDKTCVCPQLSVLLLCVLSVSSGCSTSGRQHATADLSSAPPSCQSEEPLPLSVCLPTIQLYTDTHTRSGSWGTHTLTQSRVCVLLLGDYFSFLCVSAADREKQRACDLLECSG